MTPRLCLALLLVGCAAAPIAPPTPPPARPTPPAIVPAQPVAPAPSEPPPAPSTAPPAPAPAPAPLAPATTCEIKQEHWDARPARPLRTPSGRIYATLTGADTLRFTTQDHVTAEATVHGLRLQTTPHAPDLPLYPRDELLFAGVVRAGGGTALRWSAVDGPHLRVAPAPDRRVRFIATPEQDVACDRLALQRGYGDSPAPYHRLRPRGPIAVAATMDGPPVVHLQLTRPVPVALLERVGPRAKIAWPISDGPLADATVIGWVAGHLVDELTRADGGTLHGLGGLGMAGTSHWGGCTAEHPLHVDAGRGPEPVGTILPGTRVRTGPRRGALVLVEVEGPATRLIPTPVKLHPGAQFLLAPADARDCSNSE